MNYSFINDYNETAHPEVVEAIMRTMQQKLVGYGLDDYCEETRAIIRDKLLSPTADIHFMPSGTITNLATISHILKPYQAVIAAETGHINVHETGAIEATGHKVVTVKSENGKLTPDLIKPVLTTHCDEHMVQPKLVYISNTTELGTVYSKKELQALYQFCQNHNLYLYLDGARLAMALAAKESDLTLADLAKYTDIFYIGGTKVGALMGEVLIFNNLTLSEDFRYSMKQKGAILAKGWVIAAQMRALLEDDLYIKLGKHSNSMAEKLITLFAPFTFLAEPESNQIFVIMPTALAKKVVNHYAVDHNYIMDDCGNVNYEQICLRFCTSWATKAQDIELFANQLTEWMR
ncbi:aminotransferase class I/II-fold pyridoxal phosphate-dependent enzyme [Orbaceae bacterium ESL0721]|nr:aminotransferase class I/II-fold pyridoxal phosphate-dependent enzyme [Orbaceae bacterium ESL0721]